MSLSLTYDQSLLNGQRQQPIRALELGKVPESNCLEVLNPQGVLYLVEGSLSFFQFNAVMIPDSTWFWKKKCFSRVPLSVIV